MCEFVNKIFVCDYWNIVIEEFFDEVFLIEFYEIVLSFVGGYNNSVFSYYFKYVF